MKKLILFNAILMLAFISTAVKAQEITKKYYDNGNIKLEVRYDANGKATGKVLFYHENISGAIRVVGNHSNGERNGEFKYYNDLGWLIGIEDYKNGEKISLSKGCYSGNCENGYGKKFLGWGKRQHGNFTNGVLNGEGTEISTLSGMSIYKGNFVNGKKDGQGNESFEPLRTKYTGQWKESKKNGHGIETKYNFLLGGELMEKYDGNWENGNKKGQASITEYDSKGKAEKRKIVGDWTWDDNDEPSGTGKEYKNGALVYEGTFKNGKPFKTEGCLAGDCENGQGVFVSANHVKYIGGFKNGFGYFVWDDGMKYIGEFKNGIINGLGTLTWSEGKFIGSFKEAKRSGYGREYDKDNALIKQGKWLSDLFYPNFTIEKKYSKDEKCTVGNCIDDFGIYIETFESGWSDAYRDYVNTYEIKYEGFWKEGKFHGLGFTDDRMAKTFVGLFKNGEVVK